MANVRFTRVISLNDQGTDCEGVARALIREGSAGVTLTAFNKQTIERRRTWNVQKRDWLKKYETKLGKPFTPDGIYGRGVHERLEPFFDLKARDLMNMWRPPAPPLVEPRQGFQSLHHSLWEPFSIGRRMGLYDLGTYNPSSSLPGGGPSDHSVWPAFAFDLGFDPDTGFDNDLARTFYYAMTGRVEVEYVILGNKIWTRSQGTHGYYNGGHQNHCHVSGNR